jgi:hypothetical protein
MTPKEKAKDIYLKMLKWQQDADIYLKRNIISTAAIKCALIAVNEILDIDCWDMSQENFDNHIEYWQEVKQEIEEIENK